MGGHGGFKKHEREELLNVVADLYLQGYSYRQIADQVAANSTRTISQQTAFNYVKKLKAEWLSNRLEKIDEMKAVELVRINKLEQEYWKAWYKSISKSIKTTTKKKVKPGGASGVDEKGDIYAIPEVLDEDNSVTEYNPNGDPRFLFGVQWCIQMRCRILGIEAPVEFKGNVVTDMKRTIKIMPRARPRPFDEAK
jgi:hypothetical protein